MLVTTVSQDVETWFSFRWLEIGVQSDITERIRDYEVPLVRMNQIVWSI